MSIDCSLGWNGSCELDYQNALAAGGCIEYDADVVGIGVIVAFVVSSLLAFVSVVVGYFTMSTPTYLLNDVDVMLIGRVRAILRLKKAVNSMDDASDPLRVDGLQSFMLAMSDQQLVSGIALLIAGYAKHSDITTYSMDVIAALAFLSSSVHLSTLPLVRVLLRDHSISLGIRVVFMCSNFVVSSGALIFLSGRLRGWESLMAIVSITLPRTLLTGRKLKMLAFVMVLQAGNNWYPYMFFACGVSGFTLQPFYVTDFLMQMGILVSVLWDYIDALFALYGPPGTPSAFGYILDRVYKRAKIERVPSRQQYQATKAATKKAALERSPRRVVLRDLRFVESFAFHEFNGSFAAYILTLAFIQIYGIITVFKTRTEASGSTGDMNEWGFGQIVPLVLLMLPAMSAIEAHDDYKNQKRQSQQDTLTEVDTNVQGEASEPTLSPAIATSTGAQAELADQGHNDENFELAEMGTLSRPQNLQSRRSFVVDDDDGHRSPTRQDTEARIGLPTASATPKATSSGPLILRWAEPDAEPYRWLDVRAMLRWNFFFSLGYAIIFALAFSGVLSQYALWTITVIGILRNGRIIWGEVRILRFARATKLATQNPASHAQPSVTSSAGHVSPALGASSSPSSTNTPTA